MKLNAMKFQFFTDIQCLFSQLAQINYTIRNGNQFPVMKPQNEKLVVFVNRVFNTNRNSCK